jgi:hypothetical protein
MPELVFNAARHEYRLGAQVLPSVTQVLAILEDFSAVPAEVLTRAAEFGSHVHQAVDLMLRGVLDWDSLDAALVPYVIGARRFLDESGAHAVASEMRVYHKALKYAGTLDLLADWKGQRSLFDFKTGSQVPRTVGPQTVAYALALDSMGALPVKRRYCVQLMPNDYRVTPLTDPADRSIFQSCLNLYHWRNKHAA